MVTEPSRLVVERLDGSVGLGHWIEFAGLRQLSVSWPEEPATRHLADDVQRRGFRLRCFTLSELRASTREVHQGDESLEKVVPNQVDTPSSSPSVARVSEAAAIRQYLAEHGADTPSSDVISGLAALGYDVQAAQVQREKKKLRSLLEE